MNDRKDSTMFNYKENDFKNYKTLFTQIGLAIGGYSSLVLKDNIILVFLLSIGLGYLLGLALDKNKPTKIKRNEQGLPPFWTK